jgi:preprotein translocase subunit SecD
MTELDERLAQALRDAVPSPPRVLDPNEVRAGAAGVHHLRRVFAPAIAAAAVVIVALGVLYAVRDSGSADGSRQPSGPPNSAIFEVRPLLRPAVLLMGPRSSQDSFDGIAFPLPTTEDEYDRLTDSEKLHLDSALRGVECTNPPELPQSPDRVVCFGGYAALLGPPIVTGADITSAEAVPPALPGGSTEWTVLLRLTAAGADSMRSWTSVHQTREQGTPFQTNATTPCGVAAEVACSDFLAFVVGDHVISVPVTHGTLDEAVQISDGLTETTATELASRLSP